MKRQDYETPAAEAVQFNSQNQILYTSPYDPNAGIILMDPEEEL